jgi:hypothetical protein
MTGHATLSAHPGVEFWISLAAAFVFFNGMTNGVLALAAVFRVAQTRWTPVINRICHSSIFFVPLMAIANCIISRGEELCSLGMAS